MPSLFHTKIASDLWDYLNEEDEWAAERHYMFLEYAGVGPQWIARADYADRMEAWLRETITCFMDPKPGSVADEYIDRLVEDSMGGSNAYQLWKTVLDSAETLWPEGPPGNMGPEEVAEQQAFEDSDNDS